ncbi:hypothetical protein [Winogradskyella pulchriflava]|uniref:Lipoprotein n=1 Tax=Winogradskyella pulchriflava TaxID=1110688 RepID=A0ABV6QC62_9FLAO
MKNTIYISTIICLTIVSCVTNRKIFQTERFDDLATLTIPKADKIEQGLGSIVRTPSHKISIGESIYPNKKGFNLETPKTYSRTEKGKFELETEYFYTASDSIVRVVMYEWTEIQEPDKPFGQSKTDTKKFQKKFDGLKKQLTWKLGEPSFVEIASDTAKSNFSDGIKWLSGNGNKAYLFMLGSNSTDYRKIRLAIYKE